jgi:hypothetical protein
MTTTLSASAMKNTQKKLALFTTALTAVLLLAARPAKATNYAGNTDTGFSGAVGNGVLSVTDDHTNITVNLQRGNSGSLNDVLVIYIDTGAEGYADTSSFTDHSGNGEQQAISGYNGSSRSVMTFTNGFRPSYAIAIKSDYMDLWTLANPASFSYVTGNGEAGNNSANFSMTFLASQIGLPANVSTNIRIFGTYISRGGYRSTEAIAGNCVSTNLGNPEGYFPFAQTAFANYVFAAPVAPTNPVTFSVDMTAQVASSAFIPGTDQVYVGGSFEPTPFAFGLQLTNNPAAANTNIYSGTYPDQNLTNTFEQYKFKFYSVALTNDIYDADPNRTFTLHGGGQVVPLIYFNNLPATPSATTNYITFQIDMGPQIYLSHFNPGAGDLIELSGGFQSPQFSAGIILTNNPAAANTNLYSGTVVDYNYPGTQYLPPQNGYKYVIVTSAGTNYESGANRSLVTPTNSITLPVAYFNGLSAYAAIPITFSVDMTIPILTGMLNPGNGDTVGCAGTFMTNQWTVGTGGFTLTNNPAGANSNLYSGTYIDRNAPGSLEQYKFVINTNGGGTAYESPASTGGGDRLFVLGSVAATNPLVFWNDLNTNKVVLADTVITFTVDMNGAVDVYGNPFDSGNDLVFINGDFAMPAWNYDPNINFWTVYDIMTRFPAFIMQATDTPGIYTNIFTLPAGHPLNISYKYGIQHSATVNNNTNVDNEAPSGNDHHRYVRSAGSYQFPTDTFGIQKVNAAAGVEPLYGLALGNVAGGHLPINWLGFPGVALQTSTNLANPVWENVNSTNSVGTTNWPTTGGARFFRLWPTPQ